MKVPKESPLELRHLQVAQLVARQRAATTTTTQIVQTDTNPWNKRGV